MTSRSSAPAWSAAPSSAASAWAARARLLIEKGADILSGASKGNSAMLHTGYDAPSAAWSWPASAPAMRSTWRSARISTCRCCETGGLLVAWNEAERRQLPAIVAQARSATASPMSAPIDARGAARAASRTSRRTRSPPSSFPASTSSIPGRRRSPTCCRASPMAARCAAAPKCTGGDSHDGRLDARDERRAGRRRASSSMPPATMATSSRPSRAPRPSRSSRARASSSSSTSRPRARRDPRSCRCRPSAPRASCCAARLRQPARRPDGGGPGRPRRCRGGSRRRCGT